ncbi:interleukin-1 receptor-like 2 [Tachyglossus aculeatus]|uniref:interleukin-1 receptor-like 2 n=1 Tax=Tachyglossus aculeatus TaxID=9261 RepID=UPI0018F3D196|nr:interleukin-1 receptor-like 2 [Tachyglossus aculeatus]
MTAPSWLFCSLQMAFLFSARTDNCKVSSLKKSSIAGQPFPLQCHAAVGYRSEIIPYSVNWYKNSSKTSLLSGKNSRIYQHQDWIWFLPLTLEDTGIYQCIISYQVAGSGTLGEDPSRKIPTRNSLKCTRVTINLTVFKSSENWCDNQKEDLQKLLIYIPLPLGKLKMITCPLPKFPANITFNSVEWHKDCKQIQSNKEFRLTMQNLVIASVSAQNAGLYRCNATFSFMGKHYSISRNILGFLEKSEEPEGTAGKRPEILYPQNNSIEVKLGSPLLVDCNIYDTEDSTSDKCWKVNGTLVNQYYNSNRIHEGFETKSSQGEKYCLYTVNLSFTEVRSEDYYRPFVCHLSGISAAYIMLRPPAPDLQGYMMGGLFGMLLMVVSISFIYKIFKIDIVLWYRSTFQTIVSKEDGKLYDAYVLYSKPNKESQSHALNMLVMQILPGVLEKQCGYKLFIFGRDDFPGQAVVSVADENIKLSRRLIIIIVPESSSYSFFEHTSEQQIAVYNALIQDGIKVILIELEKIKDYTGLPESIKFIKQKHGAVQWTGNFTKESQSAKTKFWKKVRYHMPPKKYPPSSKSSFIRPSLPSSLVTLEGCPSPMTSPRSKDSDMFVGY